MVTAQVAAESTTSGSQGSPFSVSVRMDGKRALVAVGGELDLTTVPILDQHLEPLKGLVDEVEYQLADLTFIDAFGLRSLLAYETNPGLGVSIRTPSLQVRRLLEIVGIASITDEIT